MTKTPMLAALALLAGTLSACGSGGQATAETAADAPATLPPPSTTIPEPSAITLKVDSTQPGVTCAGYDPIVGGEMTATVETENGSTEGLGRVEFFVDDTLAHTASEPPFSFSTNTSAYEDGTSLALRADAYDTLDNMYQSESITLRVDNSREPTLRSLGEQANIRMATHIEVDDEIRLPLYDVAYKETLCQNFDQVIDSYLMMELTQRQQGVWDFTWPDDVLEFAEENSMRIRGHPVVWGNGLNWPWLNAETDYSPNPRWVLQGDFSREETIGIMYEQIENVMTHYEGRIDEWVVVNEPISGAPVQTPLGPMRQTYWSEGIGEDYIDLAFRHAREVDPDAVLILNEFGADYTGQFAGTGFADDFYNLTAQLVAAGTPIDAVGFEMHLTVGEDTPTVEDLATNFARFAALGLDVHVSEMDVAIELPATPDELEEQARLYAIVMQACLETEACKSFAVWGHADAYSWIPGWKPGYGAATLFDEDMQPKPAYYALLDVMEAHLDQ